MLLLTAVGVETRIQILMLWNMTTFFYWLQHKPNPGLDFTPNVSILHV